MEMRLILVFHGELFIERKKMNQPSKQQGSHPSISQPGLLFRPEKMEESRVEGTEKNHT